MNRTEVTAARRRRPAAVTILAIIQLLGAIIFGILFIAAMLDEAELRQALIGGDGSGTNLISSVETATLRIVLLGFFIASLAAGILLLRMRQLGWTIAMLITGIGLASSIATWLTTGDVSTIWLSVQVVTVFYLNQRDVRRSFGISRQPAGAPEASRG